jgi:hypothetical protein
MVIAGVIVCMAGNSTSWHKMTKVRRILARIVPDEAICSIQAAEQSYSTNRLKGQIT